MFGAVVFRMEKGRSAATWASSSQGIVTALALVGRRAKAGPGLSNARMKGRLGGVKVV